MDVNGRLKLSALSVALCVLGLVALSSGSPFKARPSPQSPGNASYIAGGRVAEPNEFPWMASVQAFMSREWAGEAEWVHVCGATVVNRHWLVTARRCVQDKRITARRIIVATHRLPNDQQENNQAPHQRRLEVVQVVFHDQDDVALLRVNPAMTLGSQSAVAPACLWKKSSKGAQPPTSVVALGWTNETESADHPSVGLLHAVQLRHVPFDDCVNSSMMKIDRARHICASGAISGHLDNKQEGGLSPGDIGGPLLAGPKSGLLLAVAVSDGGPERRRPAIFQTIDRQWIVEQTGGYGNCARRSHKPRTQQDRPSQQGHKQNHSRSNYISDGRNVQPNEFPFMASLQAYLATSYQHVCGATILNREWLLTARYCVAPENVGAWRVVVGVTAVAVDADEGLAGRQELDVVKIVMHDQDDIALVRVEPAIDFQPASVGPVQLWKSSDDDGKQPSQRVGVLGWGQQSATSNDTTSRVLQTAELNLITFDQCVRAYRNSINHPVRIDRDKHLCAGRIGFGRQGICPGDTGGPLLARISRDAGTTGARTVLVGVAVHNGARTCGSREHPSIFLNVTKYRQWICVETGIDFDAEEQNDENQQENDDVDDFECQDGEYTDDGEYLACGGR